MPYKYRLGPEFAAWYALFEDAEEWDEARTDAFRHETLAGLLRDVRDGSPYYADLLRGRPLNSVASDPASYLPVMTRDAFRSNLARIRNAGFAGKLSAASTSGTSGNALQFHHAAADNAREWAAICHQWRRVGYDPFKSVRAEVRGLVTTRGTVQHFPESNMVRFSVLHLTAEHVRHYAKVCADDGVAFIHGYPSAIYIMAREMLAHGIAMPGIRGVMLASEMVYPHQVDAIEQAFPTARLIAHYGNAERVALGAWCEHRRSYHMLPLYGHVEVAPDGTLIGTNMFNRVNPFIRYRMSDRVSGSANTRCPSCGRLSMPLVEDMHGRAEDYLYSPARGWIPPAIVTYPLKALQEIHEIQFAQDRPDRIELRYTVRPGASSEQRELDAILAGLAEIVGNIELVTMRVDALDRGATGKLKWIVSTLSPTI